MKLLKAMATIASFTMLSRVAGMARDMLTASILGAGPMADAFFVALKLPNLFRRVAAEGAFSVSFIPIYSKLLEQDGEKTSGEFSGEVFSLMAIILSVFSTAVMIGMPWIINVIAPGFEHGTERYTLAVSMTQITFPYLMLMSFVALFGGMLNAHHKFIPFASAPIIFNLTLIAFMVLGTPYFPTAGHAMSVGVSVSGILQLAMMGFFIRKYKIVFAWKKPRLSDNTKLLFRKMAPGVLSAGIFQINLFVDMMIASLLPAGAISYLYYADRLNQLPLSMGGSAIGTALLPMLSRAISSEDHGETNQLFNRSLEFCFFVALPAAVALLIIPFPMVQTLFGHGKFTNTDAWQTSYVLMGYAIGLPAYIASKVFMTAFWAHQDTVTPVKISILTAVCNIILCLSLIWVLGAAGISLATGIAGWIQVYFLHRYLKDNDNLSFDTRLNSVFPKIALCSCIMAVVLSLLAYVMQSLFFQALPVKILALVALIGGGAITYAVAIHTTGVLKISDIKHYMKRSKG